jgi:predicted N-acetyltransferase YhbS
MFARNHALTPVPAEPVFRAARPQDAQPLGTICHAAFRSIAERHGFPADFPDAQTASGLMDRLISNPDIHAVVVEDVDGPIGSNFLWMENGVAGVGPITVAPARQDGRIGRKLMEAVLAHARHHGIASVRLVQAAYHGRSLALYTQLGFIAREPLSVMQGSVPVFRRAGYRTRPATSGDLDAAASLCRQIHGFARLRELKRAIDEGTAMIVERHGHLSGYTTGIGFFGHAVADTTEDLMALIASVPAIAGPGLLVPTRNHALLSWCLAQGLRIVQPMTLMTRGPYQQPGGAYLPSVLY